MAISQTSEKGASTKLDKTNGQQALANGIHGKFSVESVSRFLGADSVTYGTL